MSETKAALLETGDALAALGPSVIGPLAELLTDEQACYIAARALGKIGPASIPVLIQALKDSNAANLAGYTLGFMLPAAVEALLPLLDDPEERVRSSAVYLLTSWGPVSAPPAAGRKYY